MKKRRDLRRYILYICDKFSGYMASVVIKNKEPEKIIKSFYKKWVIEGPRIPLSGIFADNGAEFKNPSMKEMATKYGITVNLTAGRSLWSNHKYEREYYTCNIPIRKVSIKPM